MSHQNFIENMFNVEFDGVPNSQVAVARGHA